MLSNGAPLAGRPGPIAPSPSTTAAAPYPKGLRLGLCQVWTRMPSHGGMRRAQHACNLHKVNYDVTTKSAACSCPGVGSPRPSQWPLRVLSPVLSAVASVPGEGEGVAVTPAPPGRRTLWRSRRRGTGTDVQPESRANTHTHTTPSVGTQRHTSDTSSKGQLRPHRRQVTAAHTRNAAPRCRGLRRSGGHHREGAN